MAPSTVLSLVGSFSYAKSLLGKANKAVDEKIAKVAKAATEYADHSIGPTPNVARSFFSVSFFKLLYE